LERHPEREQMRNQLVTYLLGASDLSAQDLEGMLKNIFSPILKKEVQMYGTGFIAAAARETEDRVRKEERIAAEKAKIAALQLQKRTLMMHFWKKGIAPDLIVHACELPVEEGRKLILAFEKGKAYFEGKERISIPKMIEASGLVEDEVMALIRILKETPLSN
jgi:hypothetical protein